MSRGPSRDEDGDDTPPTRSYVDALLRGNLSADQVASLRAEIASRAEEESARLARSYPPPRSTSSPPSAPPSAPRSPRSYSPLPTSSPRGGSHPPSGPPPVSWPSPQSYAPTSRAPASRPPPSPPPRDDDDDRTLARAYRATDDDDRTLARVYRAVDDDDRTLARTYRPAVPVPATLPPAPPREEPRVSTPPISYIPPDDIAHPYVFEDDPPPEPEADGETLTAVHIYSSSEIGDMVTLVELADLGDLAAPSGRSLPTEPVSPEYDALLVETYLAALGGTHGIPCLAVPPARVPSLPLGPQAAFVLSRIDGGSTVEDVLDMTGLSRVETLRILYDLLQHEVIRVDGVHG
jgi:hypothetical protein